MQNKVSLGELQHNLVSYAKVHRLPSYVKQAAVTDTFCPEGLPITVYADKRHQQYPMHTKAATYCSWLKFLREREKFAKARRQVIEQNFLKSARVWNIESDLAAAENQYKASLRSPEPRDDDYAIVWKRADGQKERHYRMASSEEVKAAADAFLRWRDYFNFQDRRAIAQKLLTKAAQYKVELSPEQVEAAELSAGRGIYEPSACAEAIRRRVRLVKSALAPAVLAGMTKMAQKVAANPTLAMSPAAATALCQTIDTFDRTFGLTQKYADGLPRPEEVVYGLAYRQAEDFVKSAVELVTGRIYHKEQMQKLALQDIRDVLGEDIAEAVSCGLKVDPEKLAEVARTLPRGDAERLEDLLREAGEEPMLKRAHEALFTPEELAVWADVFRLRS